MINAIIGSATGASYSKEYEANLSGVQTLTHNLGGRVNVSVETLIGEEIDCYIKHIDDKSFEFSVDLPEPIIVHYSLR